MDDVDAFLAGLAAYASPSLDDGMQRAREQVAQGAQAATGAAAVTTDATAHSPRELSASERNAHANTSSSTSSTLSSTTTSSTTRRGKRARNDSEVHATTTATATDSAALPATATHDVAHTTAAAAAAAPVVAVVDSTAATLPPPPTLPVAPTTWTCSRCTLINDITCAACACCELPHSAPSATQHGSTSEQQQQQQQTVSCTRCTFDNHVAVTHCAMCGAALRRVAATTAAQSRTAGAGGASAGNDAGNNNDDDDDGVVVDDDSSAGDYEGDDDEEDDDEEDEVSDDDDESSDGGARNATSVFDTSRNNNNNNNNDDDDDDDGDDSVAASEHRRLVHFLQTMQAVSHEELTCAPVPATMQATAQLRLFQLQAVQWMLQRERGIDDVSNNSNNKKSSSSSSSSSGSSAEGDGGSATALQHQHQHQHHNTRNNGNDDGALASAADVRAVCGGIFADYMGLGKTRTVIALCESTRVPRVDRVTCSLVASSATLIVCPTSLLTQWVAEVRRCVQPAPRVLLYHGSRKRRCTLFDVAQQYDYVLTSYQTLCHEPTGAGSGSQHASQRNNNNNSSSNGNSSNSNTTTTTTLGKLFMIHWHRIVLDEAHCIRNVRTLQCRACLRLSGRARWAVTGTPLQNSINDLYALVCFLRVPHFSSLSWWNGEIVRYLNDSMTHPRPMTALRLLTSALLLRRTPQSRVRGEAVLALPPRNVHTRVVELSSDELTFYNALHQRATDRLGMLQVQQQEQQQQSWQHGARRASAPPSQMFNTAFEMLMRCRQSCLHPYLVVAALRRVHARGKDAKQTKQQQQQPSSSSSMSGAVGGGDSEEEAKAALFAQRVDAYVRRVLLRHVRKATLPRRSGHRRSGNDAAAAAAAEPMMTTTPTMTATGAATSATPSFVQELVASLRARRLEEQDCIICLDKLCAPAILPCGHVFCVACITHALQMTSRCPLCKCATRPSLVLRVPDELLVATSSSSSASSLSSPMRAMVGDDVDLSDYGNWPLRRSAKTRALLDIIARVPAGERVVVFSAFVTYLQYAQYCLQMAGVPCALYTGTMSVREKAEALRRFAASNDSDTSSGVAVTATTGGGGDSDAEASYLDDVAATVALHAVAGGDSNNNNSGNMSGGGVGSVADANANAAVAAAAPRVLLASLTTCGVGVNLACANHCVLMEPTWNPGVEEQALHRIYRMGQTRPVTVHRLVAAGTVEEKVDALCRHKQTLLRCCVEGDNTSTSSSDARGSDDDNETTATATATATAWTSTSSSPLRLTARELLRLFCTEDDGSDGSDNGSDNGRDNGSDSVNYSSDNHDTDGNSYGDNGNDTDGRDSNDNDE